MSNIGLFAVGAVVTLLVAASMALLIWGAILDGRYDDAHRVEDEAPADPEPVRVLHPVDAA